MDFECDSDGSTDMGDESEPEPDTNEDYMQMRPDKHLYEPERDAPTEYTVNETPIEQLNAQIYRDKLAQLHAEIKARAQTPTKPGYQKLHRTWPPRPLIVQSLPDTVVDPIYYFELLWTPEVWASLVSNTNKYTEFKIVLEKKKNLQKKGR
jgi:hypothetical protein